MAGLFAGLVALVMTPAQAASGPSVADMLGRIEKLQGMGMMAMFHKNEIKALMGEVKSVADSYRADVDKAQAARDTSLGCPPPRGQSKMSSDELIKRLKDVPVQERAGTSFKTFFYQMMKARFPCK